MDNFHTILVDSNSKILIQVLTIKINFLNLGLNLQNIPVKTDDGIKIREEGLLQKKGKGF